MKQKLNDLLIIIFVFAITFLSGCSSNSDSPNTEDELINNQNANLSHLVISNGILTFNPETTTYNFEVSNVVDDFAITATADDRRATIVINDISIVSGNIYVTYLDIGVNNISIVVTAADEITKKLIS